MHFIASAYVAVYLLRGRLHLIQGAAVRPIVRCGQQSLAVFLSGIVQAHIGGMAFDGLGTGPAAQAAINAIGFVATLAVAYGVGWIKSAPWTGPAPTPRFNRMRRRVR